jgi:DNA modification methylase
VTWSLLRGDALRVPLSDESVDLVVTSPPYFALRSYRDGGEHYAGQVGSEETPEAYLEALWAATGEMVRVLKPSGSLWVNLGDKSAGTGGANSNTGLGLEDTGDEVVDSRRSLRNNTRMTKGFRPKSLLGLPWRYAIGCIDRLGLILRAEVIWSKPNGLPESVTDRVRKSHEQWFHFTKEPRYFAAVDEIREPHRHDESPTARRGPSGQNRGTEVGRTHDDGASVGNFNHDPLGRLPGSVWTVPTEPLNTPDHLGDHFAAFPQEFPRRIILGWSPPAGVVLDPFGGTGTTAGVAHTLGRHGISIDLSADYSRLAQWRIRDSGDFSKSEQRTWADRQGSLL